MLLGAEGGHRTCRYRIMTWRRTALDLARRTGVLSVIGRWYGRDRLTVLAYHRVADASNPNLTGFRPNVSASVNGFAEQLDWIARRFTVVSLGDVLAWLDGAGALPPRPLLITFDDGYLDNLGAAAPLLAARGLPAVLFLTTGPLDGGCVLCPDVVAEIFGNSTVSSADLPMLGRRDWGSPGDRERVIREFVIAVKRLAGDRRISIISSLAHALGSGVPESIPGLYLDWEQVRSLHGWEIGAHTVTHPVLTSIEREAASEEVVVSKRRIEDEIGRPVRAFAYPNGSPGDFSDEVDAVLVAAGIDLAFTLLPGPSRASEVRAAPLAVRRTDVCHSDGLATFAGKVMGVTRMLGMAG